MLQEFINVDQIKKPLENYKNIDDFKLYVNDVGLLCAKKNIEPDDIIFESRDLNDFKGGMVENYVLSQLQSSGFTSYYWNSGNKAELDFIIQRNGNIVPIEVKSADNTQAKSLKVYMKTFHPSYSIKLSTKNFGFEEKIKTMPIYAAFCI